MLPVVIILLVWWLAWNDCHCWLTSLLATAFVAIFVVMLDIALYSTSPDNLYKSGEYLQQVVSLKEDTGISGSFVLGTGSIGSDSDYYFTAVVGDGEYVKMHTSSYDTVLKESNNELPHIQWDIYTTRDSCWVKWVYGITPGMVFNRPTYVTNKKLIVPVGTVVKVINPV